MIKLVETAIERVQGTDYCTVFTAEKKFINSLNRLKDQYPDEVEILTINEDGSIVAHVPYSWFKFIKPPTKREYTNEQKQAMAERMAKAREARGNNEV